MRPGQSTCIWLPNGRFVTRWKEQRPSANNAVTAASEDQLCQVLRKKFTPEVLKNIGVFSFSCWADQETLDPEDRGMLPEPVVAFASVLSKQEIRSRLTEIVDMVSQSPDNGPLWVEVFIRSRTPVQDEEIKRRFKPRRRDSKREYRRD